MWKKKVIAVDLGASSGRMMGISANEGKLELEEIHRFVNEGLHVGEHFYTDILYIYHEIVRGLTKAYQTEDRIEAIGIDSWGVDFALLDPEGELLGNPYHYRDAQSTGMMEKANEIFGKKGLFMLLGIQDMWFNSVYQILGIQSKKPQYFNNAARFLMIPDILGYFLTGNQTIEYTSASTTQMYDVKRKEWSAAVCYELGLEPKLFPEVVMTGMPKGDLTEKVKKLVGMPKGQKLRLIATAGHDSASAAYAVPTEDKNYVFINSGTWSIIGMVRDEPIITDEIYDKGYSNEGAAFGKIKLVKSIMGMWFIQELRKCWELHGKSVDYGFLTKEAEKAEAFSHMIDVDDALFTAPLDMEDAINQYCLHTGQTAMKGQGEFYRTVMESLAFKYRETIADLESIAGEQVDTIYLLGGAVQDKAFCRFIANATGKCVSAGPVEATAVGNAMIQMKSLGWIKNEKEHTKMIQNSFDICYYEPNETALWNQMYEKYLRIK